MTALETRILAVLGSDVRSSAWERLMALYRLDREAFYLLACDGVSSLAEADLPELADLAAQVRRAVQGGYEIEPQADGMALVGLGGGTASIPRDLAENVRQFLRELDGKSIAVKSGKDYEGSEVSEAESRFKLGERTSWAAERARLDRERMAAPLVLRVSAEDIAHLATQPAYVTHQLLQCARQTVLAPTAVFRGLKRGGSGPSKLNCGWVFCGKPRQAYRNDAVPFPAPESMVFLVYSDEDRYVFDWDWGRENPEEAGYPLDWRIRFDNPEQLNADAVLDLPKQLSPGHFDHTVASYSSRGDCIFCYMTDSIARADRINSDLTVFYALENREIAGFKIKNVRRILQQDKSIYLDDAPGLTVSVDTILLASLNQHKDPDARVEVYTVLIRALLQKAPDPPKVHLPKSPGEVALA